LKRSGSNEEIDLSFKKIRLQLPKHVQQQQFHHQQQQHQLHHNKPVKQENAVIQSNELYNEEYSQQTDSNDSSDPGRLQVDIQEISEDNDIDNNINFVNKIKKTSSHTSGRDSSGSCSGGTMATNLTTGKSSSRKSYDIGRETPDSLISSDDHHGGNNDVTDPATTQLWQALAQTTG